MNQIEARAEILSRLVAAILPQGEGWDFVRTELEGRTDFSVRVPAAYSGRILGFRGAHLRCIQLIAEILGREMNQQWVVFFEEPTDPQNRSARGPASIPDDWDTSDDAILLADLLGSCGINAKVSVRGGIAAGFDFTLEPEAHQDKAALCDPYDALYPRTKRGSPPLNLISAIGILYKAVGLSNGVIYRCEIE